MSIEDQDTTFGMKNKKNNVKNEKKEENKQILDQTAHTPREKFIIGALFLGIILLLSVAIWYEQGNF